MADKSAMDLPCRFGPKSKGEPIMNDSDHPALQERFKPSISDAGCGIHVATEKSLPVPNETRSLVSNDVSSGILR